MKLRVVFAIPGDLASLTGGYGYDRALLERLPGLGVDVTHLELPGAFPAPGAADLDATRHAVRAVSPGSVLFVDGLAFGAFPEALAMELPQPVVVMLHHPLALESGLSEARRRALHDSERAALKHVAHVVVPSAATKSALVADYDVAADRITIAPPGTQRAAAAVGSGGPGVALLAVGSVVPRKGYDVLVQSLAGLEALDWILTIAGSLDRAPDHVDALRALIAQTGLGDRVRLTGGIDAADLEAFYAKADAFVLSSHFEGYGMVLAEAMARGLPIVVTTGGAAGDTVPDDAALKVTPGDVAGLRDALSCIVEDAALRQRLAAASLRAGATLPTWEKTASIVADVLARVSEGQHR